MAIFALGFESGSEADTIYRLFHSDNSVRKGDGENYASWENTENDLLIDMILEEQDERKLYQYWFEWQSLFHTEQPLAPIYYYYVMGENEEQSWVFQLVAFNLNHQVLNDRRVRQALSHLIPREEICRLHNEDSDNWYPDTVTPAEPCAIPLDPEFWAADRTIEPYPYDPEQAKELLSEAGYFVETTTPPPTKTLPPTTPPFPIDGRLCPLVIVLMIVIAAAIGIKKITSENGKGPEGGNGKGPERKKRSITSRWPREWLTEKRIAGFWVYPYLWTIQNTHYVTIVIVKGEDTDEKKEPILGETVNVVLFDEEDHPLHLLSRPGGGALPEFGGTSISVNAHFQFRVSAQPLKLMAVTVRDDVKIFDVRETTKAKERKEFPKKPTKWKCCVKAFDVPANRSGRKLKKGRLYESFHMNVDFNDKGKCQSRSCEFRQYIRGTFTLDGVAAIHQLPDGPLDPVIWCEDGIPHHFRKGHHMFYGHRDNPDTYADKYNPERATGHEYRGSDSPMMSDPDPAVTMVMNLEFRGEIIDVASGKAIRTTRWKVNHSGR